MYCFPFSILFLIFPLLIPLFFPFFCVSSVKEGTFPLRGVARLAGTIGGAVCDLRGGQNPRGAFLVKSEGRRLFRELECGRG